MNKEGSSALHAACQKNTGDTGAIVTELLLARIDVSLVDSEVPCAGLLSYRENEKETERDRERETERETERDIDQLSFNCMYRA